MRAIVFTEELMGVALKFSRKSTNMGSLLVSWDPPPNSSDGGAVGDDEAGADLITGIKNRKQFNRRVQATITLCFAMLFVTIFLFFLCALDSSTGGPLFVQHHWRRRSETVAAPPKPKTTNNSAPKSASTSGAAMSRMGVVFRRGTRSMSDIVVAHATEDLSAAELRLFVGMVHRSGVMAHSDLVLIFPGDPKRFAAAVDEEDRAFKQILHASGCPMSRPSNQSETPRCGGGRCCGGGLTSNSTISPLNVAAYERSTRARPRKSGNSSSSAPSSGPGFVALGAILGFDAAELDPLDTLSGFIDRPPLQLRRWICYQMLLGIVRRRYKSVLATQIRGVFIADDGFITASRQQHDDGRSLLLVEQDRSWLDDESISGSPSPRRHHRHSSDHPGMIESVYGKSVWEAIDPEDKAGWAVVSAGVVAGGVRGVRALSEAMATEIARTAMLRRNRRPFGDAAAVNYVLRRNVGVLGQKVVDRVVTVGRTGAVNSVVPRRDVDVDAAIFVQHVDEGGRPYSIVVVEDGPLPSSSSSSSLSSSSSSSSYELRVRLEQLVVRDLCSSPREASVYVTDCTTATSTDATSKGIASIATMTTLDRPSHLHGRTFKQRRL